MNDFVAGLLAGVVSTIVVHPIDTIKVTMQSHSTHSIRKAINAIIQLNSIKGLYRGVPPHLLVQCTSQTMFYGTYGTSRRFLRSDIEEHVPISLLHNFIAGSIGGFMQSFLSCHFELLKIRLQTTNSQQAANMIQLYRHIIKTDGTRGLMRGLHATIWRDTPTYGAYMMVYDPLKDYLHSTTNSELFAGLIAGGTVGVMSWTLGCPFDVCKSKQQAGLTNKGLFRCALDIYRYEGGIYGLFCGWTAIATRAFILNAVSLFVWDRTRRWF